MYFNPSIACFGPSGTGKMLYMGGKSPPVTGKSTSATGKMLYIGGKMLSATGKMSSARYSSQNSKNKRRENQFHQRRNESINRFL